MEGAVSTSFPRDPRSIPVRADLTDAIERAWRHLAGPGTWWTGAERLRMVAETRNALSCPLCRERKAALSPYTVKGEHRSLGELPAVVVEVIHRIRTDAGRLTKTWLEHMLAAELTDAHYVEIVGLVATTSALDTFARAMGTEARPLPAAIPGEPTRLRPKGAKRSIAWVPTLTPETLGPEDPDIFSQFGSVNIQRALSLVPDSMIGFFDLDIALYLPQDAIRDFTTEHRAISHAQLELIAAKASAINGCYY
jgi:alkylhydroperoxidase family enzyme